MLRDDRAVGCTAILAMRQANNSEEPKTMAAMKPRTGDGPLEATKEGRGIVMRIPSEGGGRLVIELTPEEAKELAKVLAEAV